MAEMTDEQAKNLAKAFAYGLLALAVPHPEDKSDSSRRAKSA